MHSHCDILKVVVLFSDFMHRIVIGTAKTRSFVFGVFMKGDTALEESRPMLGKLSAMEAAGLRDSWKDMALYCAECTRNNDYALFRLLQSMSQELGKWLSNQEEKELEKQICWSKPPPASLTSPPWRLPHTLLRASDVNKVCICGHAVWYKLIGHC